MKGKKIMQGVCFIAATAAAGEPAEVNYASVRGETVQNYYLEKFQNNMQQYKEAVDNAKTFDDAQKLVMQARSRMQRAFRFPAEKCDLQAKKLGEYKHESGVTLEKVIFQSRKNFTVTANFFCPANAQGKVPAVLLLAGHSLSGKAYEIYSLAALNLANHGIAVLAIDPIQQGERIQYTGKNPGLTVGHNILNRHLLPIGEHFAQWRVYDAIRAVDYLISRGDIDPARIGVTGCSGGGTLTSLLNGCEERLAAAAPSCYITTFLRNVENELPADAEQMPHKLLADGGEMADFLLAYAPRPVRILAQERDFFDARGARETYAMLKKLYTLLGKPENVSLVVGDSRHGMSLTHRQNIYDFFTGTFLGKRADKEIIPEAIPEETLLCLPEGGVLTLPGETTVPKMVIERMDELKKIRAQRKLTLKEMQKELAGLMRITPPAAAAEYKYRALQFMVRETPQKEQIARFAVETEKNMHVMLFTTRNEYDLVSKENAILYLPAAGCRQEVTTLLKLGNDQTTVFGLDYRGIGELEPSGCFQEAFWRGLAAPYNYDYHFSGLALMLDKPMIGGRVNDVLQIINLLRSRGAKNITLRAAGVSKTVAVLAAVLCDVPVKLELEGEVMTYDAAARERITPYLQSFIVPGILELTDLDELLELQKSRF